MLLHINCPFRLQRIIPINNLPIGTTSYNPSICMDFPLTNHINRSNMSLLGIRLDLPYRRISSPDIDIPFKGPSYDILIHDTNGGDGLAVLAHVFAFLAD
jgi:hypothetical protein